jgi:hypothetical protein
MPQFAFGELKHATPGGLRHATHECSPAAPRVEYPYFIDDVCYPLFEIPPAGVTAPAAWFIVRERSFFETIVFLTRLWAVCTESGKQHGSAPSRRGRQSPGNHPDSWEAGPFANLTPSWGPHD